MKLAAAAGIGLGVAAWFVGRTRRTWRAVRFPSVPVGVIENTDDPAYVDVVASIKGAWSSSSPEALQLAQVTIGHIYTPNPFVYELPSLSGLGTASDIAAFPYVNLTEFGIYVVELKIANMATLQLSEGFSDDELIKRVFEDLWMRKTGNSFQGYDTPEFRDFRFAAESSIRTLAELMTPGLQFPNPYPVATPTLAVTGLPIGTPDVTPVVDGQVVGFPLAGQDAGSQGIETVDFFNLSRLSPLQSNVEGGIDWLAVRPVLLSTGTPMGGTVRQPVLFGRVNRRLVYGEHIVSLHAYDLGTAKSQTINFTLEHQNSKVMMA